MRCCYHRTDMAHPELRQSDGPQPRVCLDGEGELGNDGRAQTGFDEP